MMKHEKIVYWGIAPTVLGIFLNVPGWITGMSYWHEVSRWVLLTGFTGLIVSVATGLRMKNFNRPNMRTQKALLNHKRLSYLLVGTVFLMIIVRFFAESRFLEKIHVPYILLSLVGICLVAAVRRFGKQLRLSRRSSRASGENTS